MSKDFEISTTFYARKESEVNDAKYNFGYKHFSSWDFDLGALFKFLLLIEVTTRPAILIKNILIIWKSKPDLIVSSEKFDH